MIVFLTIVHVSVCLFLILVVLLQTGKGADLAGAFGGGGSQTAFGARGATTLLHKITTGSAVAFMATSLILAVMASNPSSSVVTDPDASPAIDGAPVAGTDAAPVDPVAVDETPTDAAGDGAENGQPGATDSGEGSDAGTSPAVDDPDTGS